MNVFLLCLALILQPAWAGDLNPTGKFADGGTIALHIGKHPIHAEVASTPSSRQRGLMQRDHLCADCGMLFVFENADRHSFWMKNTPLPLSIAFISATGSIINIEEMQPNTTDDHSAQSDALYGLEMGSGWFAKNGIAPDDKVQELKP